MRWITIAAALQLCACQKLSGLSDLYARPEIDSAVQTQEPVSTDPDSALRDAGMDAMVRESGFGARGEAQSENDNPDAGAPSAGAAGIAGGTALPVAGAGPLGPMSLGPIPTAAGGVGGGVPTLGIGGVAGASGSAGSNRRDAGMDEGAAGAAGPVDPDPVCTPPTSSGPVCSLAPQCGCEENQSCAIHDRDRVSCVAAGTAGLNQRCESEQDCAPGYQCWSFTCLKLCNPSQPACSDSASCLELSYQGVAIPGAGVCDSRCNLARPQSGSAETACGAGLSCLWFEDNRTLCAAAGGEDARHGTFCGNWWGCAPGYVCMNGETCAKWCVDGNDCPTGFSCDRVTPTDVAGTSYGQCKPSCIDPSEHVCSLSTQCGCEVGRTCDVLLTSDKHIGHWCRPIGQQQLYGSCDSSIECGRAAGCSDSECQPRCLSDLDCGRYSSCVSNYYDSAPDEPAGSTCKRPCDPADPHRAHGIYGACRSGMACYVAEDGASGCRRASLSGAAGTSCDTIDDCAEGHTCLDTGRCVQYCLATIDCRAGTCIAFGTSQFAADVEWGHCDTTM